MLHLFSIHFDLLITKMYMNLYWWQEQEWNEHIPGPSLSTTQGLQGCFPWMGSAQGQLPSTPASTMFGSVGDKCPKSSSTECGSQPSGPSGTSWPQGWRSLGGLGRCSWWFVPRSLSCKPRGKLAAPPRSKWCAQQPSMNQSHASKKMGNKSQNVGLYLPKVIGVEEVPIERRSNVPRGELAHQLADGFRELQGDADDGASYSLHIFFGGGGVSSVRTERCEETLRGFQIWR